MFSLLFSPPPSPLPPSPLSPSLPPLLLSSPSLLPSLPPLSPLPSPFFNKFVGGYSLGQDQTYFALKLPQDWWIFGVDLGLYNDIDINQLRYFLV
jgi:hypothetical protein